MRQSIDIDLERFIGERLADPVNLVHRAGSLLEGQDVDRLLLVVGVVQKLIVLRHFKVERVDIDLAPSGPDHEALELSDQVGAYHAAHVVDPEGKKLILVRRSDFSLAVLQAGLVPTSDESFDHLVNLQAVDGIFEDLLLCFESGKLMGDVLVRRS